MTGNEAQAAALGTKRIELIAMARALDAAVKVIGMEPGACQKCAGHRQIPGTLVLPGGQRQMVPCTACSGVILDQSPATEAAIASSNGVPSSAGD